MLMWVTHLNLLNKCSSDFFSLDRHSVDALASPPHSSVHFNFTFEFLVFTDSVNITPDPQKTIVTDKTVSREICYLVK